MAYGLDKDTFSNLGGAVSDLFGGLGVKKSAALKGEGIRIGAEGLRIKARGDIAEAQNYELAAGMADRNALYTSASTAVKEAQAQREALSKIGGQQADVAGAGFAASGTALYLLQDSAAQGALNKAVLAQQGAIAEEGYREQAKSYLAMAKAGRFAAESEFGIAARHDTIAAQTEALIGKQSTGSFISAALKGASAVASVMLAPATGGASLVGLGVLGGAAKPTDEPVVI